jgi:signal transduction histidine kinase
MRPAIGAAILGCLLLSACGERIPEGVVSVERADLHLGGEMTAPPPADGPGWTSVTLPDLWRSVRRRVAVAGWYRMAFDLPAAPDELFALYFARPGMNLAVYVNGAFVGDGGRFTEPIARNWNRPLFFPVPARLLVAGPNRVDVYQQTNPSSPVLVSRMLVGPERLVRPLWEWRFLTQVTLAEVAAVLTVVVGLLVGIVYSRLGEVVAYRWLTLGFVLLGVAEVNSFARDIPFPTRVWEWTQAVATNCCVPALIFAFHRQLRIERPRLERFLMVTTVIGAVGLLFLGPFDFFVGFLAWLAVTLVFGGYLLTLLARIPQGGHVALVPAALGIAFGLRDLHYVVTGGVPDQLLSFYIAPVALLVTGGLMLVELAEGLGRAESLNRDLEGRVAEKSAELQRNHARLRELERERAVTAERARIMQDVHDGTGGQLVSTLAMVESGRFTPGDVAEALRGALDDLRLVIDSLEPVDDDLIAALATVRGRLEPQLARHGLAFDWQVTELPALAGFGPERVLQVLRIVQEAITNVVKHARARTIRVSTGIAPSAAGRPGVFVEIRDDGVGLNGAPGTGRGLSNMQRRATALGGEVRVGSESGGTSVRLWLPR